MGLLDDLIENKDNELVREAVWEANPMFTREDFQLRDFLPFQFGDIYLSVQASAHHHCSPRKTLDDVRQYRSMEMALVRDGELVTVPTVLPEFAERTAIEDYYNIPVYSNVPIDLLEELYEALKAALRH